MKDAILASSAYFEVSFHTIAVWLFCYCQVLGFSDIRAFGDDDPEL